MVVDLNYDEYACDVFYKSNSVSAGGLNGLIPKMISGVTNYEVNFPIMVWSAGPDKKISPGTPANAGDNKDNILSWK